MTSPNIPFQRFRNQGIANPGFEEPEEVVRWLGAVQAQDYAGSLWAVGLRLRQATREAIERAIAARTIVRTWPMRGTLHFVAPEDVRWMLKLLARRVVAGSANRELKRFGIDKVTIARSRDAIQNAMQGGRQLPRNDVYRVLEAAGISALDQRGYHIVWRLAQEGLICCGARQGKQPTFVLLDEWVPQGKTLEGSQACAELARRYFTSHGPATIRDFMWWTGLTKAEATTGLAEIKSELASEVYEDQEYWRAPTTPAFKEESGFCCLLPPFDEYLVGYTDRSLAFHSLEGDVRIPGYGILSPTITINGQVVGTWKRTTKRDLLVITPDLFREISKAEMESFAEALQRYGKFIGLPVEANKLQI